MLRIRRARKRRNTLDHAVAVASAALAIDGIVTPFLTGGCTLHEQLNRCGYCAPCDQYAAVAEPVAFAATQVYLLARTYYWRR
jgi:hypothetical protein